MSGLRLRLGSRSYKWTATQYVSTGPTCELVCLRVCLCCRQRFVQAGAIVTTSEAVLLQLVTDKDHPAFKDIQALIKVSAPVSGLVPLASTPADGV